LSLKEIAPGVHHTNAGAGVFIIVRDDVTIIDAGVPGKTDQVLTGLRELGRRATDVKRILVTHYHQDHVGGLTALADATGAEVYVPRNEAGLIRDGGTPPPVGKRGVVGAILYRMVSFDEQPGHPVHHEVSGGDEIDAAGGVRVIDTPGHSVGHVVYLLPNDGVVFVGDAAANLTVLGVMPINEDFPAAEKSFRTLAELDFEVAGMAHGRQITGNASERFRKAARRYS
jgi:glyoxylase-like metal-dependent hydrolase (beta-lactamase superfamily II)